MVDPIWPLVLEGDPESACVDILRNYTPELEPYDLNRITTSLVGYERGMRWVVVTREGGSKSWPKISRPRIDLNVLAESRDIACDVINLCEASIIRAAGSYRGFGVTLCAAGEEVGPFRVPDKYSESPQYVVSLRLHTTPDRSSTPGLS